ncbi:signal recognition particle-docking protein FtsY [Desulfovibrio intestinalis]|uniref:Signal recognition particle receptor FtsY n=1 Tax=Desulfovibrio intestinalis TaxID=58621 RepID=A0A7W8C1J9_9BACT|nr:signal recognition particle-docking protein FtsY [Desulfovibrio intestinalis]MBB5141990.1 fused signal recognition particle receptor [Desulfovibrio intestinalis]
MGFFSAIKKMFGSESVEGQEPKTPEQGDASALQQEQTSDQPLAQPEKMPAGESSESAPPATSGGPAVAVTSADAPLDVAPAAPATTPNAPAAPGGVERTAEEPAPTELQESITQPASEIAVATATTAAPVAAPAASGAATEPAAAPSAPASISLVAGSEEEVLTLRLREAEPRLSVWLGIVLEGVDETGDLLWQRLSFLLGALEAPPQETQAFVDDFRAWTQRMEYRQVEEFRSELQYRLALALDLEDEEDERSRLFIKITEGLARTREQFARGLDSLFSSHGELDDAFWEELEELFIMADLGYEPSMELVERLKERARKEKVTEASGMRALLMAEVEEIFRAPRRIAAINPPEVVLMIGVNGVGKTTTIAKLAHRARMQGKKVMIAAADTFRAAAIEQLQVWAGRVGATFHAKAPGADPASVAYEAMDRAVKEGVDVLFVDTAGRLQTKVNLMEELTKIRQVLGKKHPGAPHRSILVIDATTGQNALSQTKLFKEAAGVDELILTKLDGTAKGGVAIAVAMQHHLPITFVGLGEKLEDLRPFNGEDYARALLGQKESGAA